MLGLNPRAERASTPQQQLLWRICQHVAQDCGGREWDSSWPSRGLVGKGSGQELAAETGLHWLSMTQEIKRRESLAFSLGVCFYTLNFLLGESKCTSHPSPGCPKGGDGLGSSGLPI